MLYAIVTVLVLILDQGVKYWTNMNLPLGETKELIPDVIQLTHIHNTGAALGMLEDSRWLLVALTLVACVVILVILGMGLIDGKLGRWLLVLIMAGGLGNLIDRLMYGYVVDMFEFLFVDFYVFNVADIFISVCGVIFCIWLIFHKSKKPTEAPVEGSHPNAAGRTAESGITRQTGRRAGGHEAQQSGPDYITQMRRPVTQTRAMLENEKLAAQSGSPSDDPFAEFYSAPRTQAPARPAPQPAPGSQQPRRPAPAQPPAPQPAAAPKPAPAPKKSDLDFTLEDILAEFSDK